MGLVSASAYIARVDLINLDELFAQGVRCLLIDRDNTLEPRDTKQAPPAVRAWLDRARQMGFSTWIISNNIHGEELQAAASKLGCKLINFACKPLPFAMWQALKEEGVSKEEAVLIGDQLFTDILGANIAGIRSILVRPQSTSDLWYTNIFRIGERKILGKVSFEGEEWQGQAR